MRFEFKLPDIGEGVAEGEIVGWHVKPGDIVKEDQAMVEVMTDKATVTIGAPKKGTILETLAKVGDIVPVGKLLVVIEVEGARGASPKAEPAKAEPAKAEPAKAEPKAAKDEGPAATAVGDIKDSVPGGAFFGGAKAAATPLPNASPSASPSASQSARQSARHGATQSASQSATPTAATARVRDDSYHSDHPLATPAVRKLARDLGVDLKKVRPTGEGNRVSHDDVKSYAAGGGAAGGRESSAPPAAASAAPRVGGLGRAPVVIAPPAGTPASLEERKPFVGVRRKIAERMQTSKTTAAHFTFVEECDVGRVKELRKRLQPAAEKQGVKLTFLPFIVKAVVQALKKFPVLNSALDESTNELVTRRYYHIGIAASTDQGLMVPVVKDADKKSILEIAREIDRLGNAAKAGSIASADLAGSTFTITSLGTQGGLFATPVLNFPEVGILGVHQIKKKPVVKDDQIVIGEIMLLSLSFDHRIVDGHVGAAFAYEIIGALESPEAMFLDMS
ncbi:MAG: 2-oxo acid dehydrogenase subunit E2 [Sandaracinaceae bacterium]|nr:2-oxo acid dehydrogenase subunit E2 [Sandaracinaceae bacterium]